MIRVGQKVTCEISHVSYTVIRKLGEGGQGAVFLVENGKEQKAVKWYNEEQSTDVQRKNILSLITEGAPGGASGRRFVWPLDIVSSAVDTRCFGYLMQLIDMEQYAELGEIWARKKPEPRLLQKSIISYEIANSYRQLHLTGRCYRDISRGNVIFNPLTGDTLICDNDNIGVNKSTQTQIKGTLEFMAPEVILGQASPSTQTDLFSLAVLLFQLWIKHHPFDGMLEYEVRCWDLPAKRRVYGEQAIFIFDPDNPINCLPEEPAYHTPRRAWNSCPQILKDLFTRSFVLGAKNPDRRVTEIEWQNAFWEMRNNILLCPRDNAEILCFHDTPAEERVCWYCGDALLKPIHLMIHSTMGTNGILLSPHTKLYYKSLDRYADEESGSKTAAELVKNPKNPKIWGLKNLTEKSWELIKADGSTQPVAPGRSVPILPGNSICFSKAMGITGHFQ